MQIQEKSYSNAIIGNSTKLLEAIHQKENSIAIYQRDTATLQDDISMAMQNGTVIKASGTVEEIAIELAEFFALQLPSCQALLNDINKIMNHFAELANADSYHLLLSTVSGNMCRKFHTDINDLRLLCTYSGPGTLWVSEDNSNLEEGKRHKKGLSIKEENIHQVNTGDVIILKGALHPEGNPILHRSPTIEETGEKRLLLRLDTNSFISY